MTRDYSQFFSSAPSASKTAPEHPPMARLGWQQFFLQQIDAGDLADTPPARVTEVHRNGLQVLGDGIDKRVPPVADATVGDWLLLDPDSPADSRILARKSLFKRRAAGTGRQVQLIAANIDTAFVVTSCNDDFNVARLERYVALAFEAGVAAVIVLTKPDLCTDPSRYLADAAAISDRVPAVLVNALDEDVAARFADWCSPGQTLAFLGSSGVGKSTLTNALCSDARAAVAGVRADDSKGRHTTTRRQLHFAAAGFAVLDTPGMRELQLTETGGGISEVFPEIAELVGQCRFNDCRHESEPGCAVRDGLETGKIDAARLTRWRKLDAEERHNNATLAERRASDKAFGKKVRAIMKQKGRPR